MPSGLFLRTDFRASKFFDEANWGEPGQSPLHQIMSRITDTQNSPETTFGDFLIHCPPNRELFVSEFWQGEANKAMRQPELLMHCGHEKCGGIRTFKCVDGRSVYHGSPQYIFVLYRCANCEFTFKSYAIVYHDLSPKGVAKIKKLGENPAFGPPLPSKVISLIGPDRDLFFKGRSCENQSLGIAASAYYRRVIENQKARIIDEIIRVAKLDGNKAGEIQQLEAARREHQFSNVMKMLSDVFPPTLLIKGQNPLHLLYGVLSQGVHQDTDEECLEIAHSIRIILTELAEKISQAIKDEKEINDALAALTRKISGQKASKKSSSPSEGPEDPSSTVERPTGSTPR